MEHVLRLPVRGAPRTAALALEFQLASRASKSESPSPKTINNAQHRTIQHQHHISLIIRQQPRSHCDATASKNRHGFIFASQRHFSTSRHVQASPSKSHTRKPAGQVARKGESTLPKPPNNRPAQSDQSLRPNLVPAQSAQPSTSGGSSSPKPIVLRRLRTMALPPPVLLRWFTYASTISDLWDRIRGVSRPPSKYRDPLRNKSSPPKRVPYWPLPPTIPRRILLFLGSRFFHMVHRIQTRRGWAMIRTLSKYLFLYPVIGFVVLETTDFAVAKLSDVEPETEKDRERLSRIRDSTYMQFLYSELMRLSSRLFYDGRERDKSGQTPPDPVIEEVAEYTLEDATELKEVSIDEN